MTRTTFLPPMQVRGNGNVPEQILFVAVFFAAEGEDPNPARKNASPGGTANRPRSAVSRQSSSGSAMSFRVRMGEFFRLTNQRHI